MLGLFLVATILVNVKVASDAKSLGMETKEIQPQQQLSALLTTIYTAEQKRTWKPKHRLNKKPKTRKRKEKNRNFYRGRRSSYVLSRCLKAQPKKREDSQITNRVHARLTVYSALKGCTLYGLLRTSVESPHRTNRCIECIERSRHSKVYLK